MRTKPTLGFSDAHAIVTGCLESARSLGVNVSIAVVDEAGKLIHFTRMDEARAYTADLAIRKAQSSAGIGVPTSMLEALAKERPMQDVLALRHPILARADANSARAVLNGVRSAVGVAARSMSLLAPNAWRGMSTLLRTSNGRERPRK